MKQTDTMEERFDNKKSDFELMRTIRVNPNGWILNKQDAKSIKDFISTEIQRAKASERQRCVEATKYECGHAPMPPKDINESINGIGGWFLGRIDGLNSLQKRLKAIDQAKQSLEQLK